MERLVKYGLLVVLVACSSKKQAPPPPPPPPAPVPAPMKPPEPQIVPIDLPAAGVSKLTVHPSIDPNNRIEVEWNALARNATVACREDAYNLVAFDTGDPDGIAKGSHALEWHPEPFVTPPKTCEVRFYDDKHRVLARACYHESRLDPTDCPQSPPKGFDNPDVPGISVEGASLHGGAKSVELRALVTKIADYVGPRTFQFVLTCDGRKGKLVDDSSHLAELDAGDTVFARFSFDFATPLPKFPPATCELAITDPKKVGTFCIAEGSTNPGPCGK